MIRNFFLLHSENFSDWEKFQLNICIITDYALRKISEKLLTVHIFTFPESNDRHIVCTLTPDEVANFRVKFQPSEIGKYESSIRIAVMGNPYENITLTLDGESFNEAVVLDGLEFADANPKLQNKTNISDTSRRNRKATFKNISARSSRNRYFNKYLYNHFY